MDETKDPLDIEVPCRRVERAWKIREHLRCPYCFGRREDILAGDHRRFCDFVPGVDPIAFGFPHDRGRFANG